MAGLRRMAGYSGAATPSFGGRRQNVARKIMAGENLGPGKEGAPAGNINLKKYLPGVKYNPEGSGRVTDEEIKRGYRIVQQARRRPVKDEMGPRDIDGNTQSHRV